MKSILLVEDNPDDVQLTMRALRKSNIANRLDVARDGAEALQYLERTRDSDLPTVVLLDLKLPKIDGLEVLRRMRSSERTRNIPVVVLTSSDEHPDLVESYQLGANSYIRKPVDFNQFTEAVQVLGMFWLLINESPPNPSSP